MIVPILVTICAGAATRAAIRRDWSGNAAWVAYVTGLMAAFGHSVGGF